MSSHNYFLGNSLHRLSDDSLGNARLFPQAGVGSWPSDTPWEFSDPQAPGRPGRAGSDSVEWAQGARPWGWELLHTRPAGLSSAWSTPAPAGSGAQAEAPAEQAESELML